MACAMVLCEHPDGLVTKIMAWLSVAELGRCICTCKDWSRRGCTDELWWGICSKTWSKAKIADGPWHRRWATIMGRGATHGPRHGNFVRPLLIACPPKWALPPAQEEEEEDSKGWVRASTLAEVLTWRGSLEASFSELKRMQITDQELVGSTWALRFRLHPGPHSAFVTGPFFRKDRKFVDAAIFSAELPGMWSVQGCRVVVDAPGNPSIQQISFSVTRLPNWSWHLYSPMYKVEMLSIHERADAGPPQRALLDSTALGEQVSADGEPLQWPTLPDNLIGTSELEAWKEYDVYAAEDDEYRQNVYYDGRDESLDDDFQQLLMGPNGEDEDKDSYAACYDSPAQYPESEQSDADQQDFDLQASAGISPRSLQRTLNEMLLYDSYGSDDLTPAP